MDLLSTGLNPEGGTAKKSCRPPPPQVNFWNSPYCQYGVSSFVRIVLVVFIYKMSFLEKHQVGLESPKQRIRAGKPPATAYIKLVQDPFFYASCWSMFCVSRFDRISVSGFANQDRLIGHPKNKLYQNCYPHKDK